MKKINLITSFCLYVAGLGSLFLIDAFISKLGSVDDISLWAFLRSSVMLAGFIVLLGCDQALIRNFDKIGEKIVVVMLGTVFLLSIPAAHILSEIREDVSFRAVMVFVLAVALSSVVASYYRGAYRLIASQYISNNWKFLLFFSILFFYGISDKVSIIPALIVSSGIVIVINMVLLAKMYYAYKRRLIEPWLLRSFYLDGLRFLLMGGTLNLSVNLEQVLLNETGSTADGAYLFSYITAFGAIFILANGFYGFVLGPYAKKNKVRIFRNYPKFLLVNVTVCAILLFFAFAIGSVLYDFLYSEKFELRSELVMLVLLIFGFRFLYVIPSALIGFAGGVSIFNKYVAVNVVSLGLFVSLFFIFNYLLKDSVLAILLASLFNWIVRVVAGLYLVQKNVTAERL